jgi:tyrosine-specific transport protein
VTLEASWVVRQQQQQQQDETAATGFLSITKTALGPIGEVMTALLFWFLLTSIIVAYTSEGGQLLVQAVQDLASLNNMVPSPAVGSTIFMAFFASLGIFGTSKVDLVNRFLVVGLIGSFLGLVSVSLPGISVTNLSSWTDWSVVYPQVISIGILSFGAQNVVPTLLPYLGGNPDRTRRAILIGSLIPLVMYSLWEAVFLGVVPFDAAASMTEGGSKMQVVTALGEVGGVIVKDLVEIFSACSIGSSMAGASVSLIDFFQDAIATMTKNDSSNHEMDEKPTMTSKFFGGSRLLAAALALAPPLGLACAFPDAFLGALENAGLIGGVSLYGILPALAVLNLRRRDSLDGTKSRNVIMPGRIMGGDTVLYLIAAISAALIIPDLVAIGSGLLS